MPKEGFELASVARVLILLLMVFFGQGSLAAGAGAASMCIPVKECGTAIDKHLMADAMNQSQAATIAPGTGLSMQEASGKIILAGSKGVSTACPAKDVCVAAKARCNPANKALKCTPKDCASLDPFIVQMTTACAANAQAIAGGTEVASTTSGSLGTNPLLMGAAGLAVGAGAMAAINNGKSDKKVDARHAAMTAEPRPGTAALDCNINGSEVNPECNTEWEARCKDKTDDAPCQSFAARYCNPAENRNGVASAYCKNRSAVNFCKTTGRGMCPSCMQLEKNRSPACANNPSLCQAQYSAADLDKAKASCPTDPAFADPNFSASRPALPGETTPVISVASAGTGPRPDIGGQFGKNLFSISSGAIRVRCQTGRLNNCK
jgi:hypothetical protein